MLPIPRPGTADNLRLVRKLFSDPPVALDEINATYGPICGLGSGPMRVVVIGGPELIQQLFATPMDSFHWAHKFNVVGLRFVIGRTSMIVSDGADHDRRRAPAQPAFARRRLNEWIPMIVGRTDAAIDQLRIDLPADGGALVDMYPVGRRLILGITLQAFFGDRVAARVDEMGDLYVRPQRFIEAPAVKQLPHPIPFTFRARVRADRRAIDVLDVYLDSGLSDVEIRDQVRSLIGAGYDTTAASFAWMLLCAASTPVCGRGCRQRPMTCSAPSTGNNPRIMMPPRSRTWCSPAASCARRFASTRPACSAHVPQASMFASATTSSVAAP